MAVYHSADDDVVQRLANCEWSRGWQTVKGEFTHERSRTTFFRRPTFLSSETEFERIFEVILLRLRASFKELVLKPNIRSEVKLKRTMVSWDGRFPVKNMRPH